MPRSEGALLIEEGVGGQAHVSDDKKRAYQRNGVKEYIVWQIWENELNWFRLQSDEYVQLDADADGVIKCQVFRGLWLATSALLTGDMIKVLEMLEQGLKSKKHTAPVQQLSHSDLIK